MGTVFILIILTCFFPGKQYNQIFRQVFWLPDHFTSHTFPFIIVSTVVFVTFIPGYSGGSVPESHRIPYYLHLQHLKSWNKIDGYPVTVKEKFLFSDTRLLQYY